ncbi:MAG: nucleotidyltransferase domain-containing protein [Candidatus Bathyarchaeia archaeon]
MWLPRWAGEPYAMLYEELGLDTFNFKDAARALPIDDLNMIKVILSKLHKESLLMIFERSRPRLYRLMDPETFITLASGKIKKVKIPQEKYLKLIYDSCRILNRSIDLDSLAVYGSVARGSASSTSDIDLFVVSNDLKGTLGERIEFLLRLMKNEIKPEIEFLNRNEVRVFISLYPLKKEEAEKLPLIMLDMVDDAKIVYDKDDFLEKQLLRLKLKLMELGAKKVYIGKNRWYWDLHPSYKPLEVISL